MIHRFIKKVFKNLALLTVMVFTFFSGAADALDLTEYERICASGSLEELKTAASEWGAGVAFPSGNHPLHVVAEHATDPEMVNYLMEKGADLSELGLEKLTPLMLSAAYNSSPLLTEALLRAGAPVDSADAQGRTPLALAAASNDSPEVVAVLLNHGASANLRDSKGRTPLWLAASRSDENIVRLLIEAGAKPNEISDDVFKRIIAVVRLALPYTGMIISTREKPELKRELLRLGISQLSAGSRTSPGGYAEAFANRPEAQQFWVGDERELPEIIRDLQLDGYLPSFCTSCYRKGRTGDHFMGFAKSMFIHNYCHPNALLTYYEYLLDYAGPEAREAGKRCIMENANNLVDPQERETMLERLRQIENGVRDICV